MLPVSHALSTPLLYPPTPTENSYIELLDDGSAENVIRFASNAPRSASWSTHVSAKDMLLLFKATGQISVAARRVLRTLHPSCRKKTAECVNDLLWETERTNILTLFFEGCTVFTKLHLDSTSPYGFFTAEIPNLKELHINVDGLFSTFSIIQHCDLEALYVSGSTLNKENCEEIERHCRNLRVISIECRCVESTFEGLFSHIGSTLTELELPADGASWVATVIPVVAEHCSQLERLSFVEFEDNDVFTRSILRICKRNRRTLKTLDMFLNRGDTEFLAEVVSVCPSIEIMWQSTWGEYAEQLIAMGSCARNIFTYAPDHLRWIFREISATEVCATCVNLSHLDVWVSPVEFDVFSEFFTGSLKLKSVTVYLGGTDNALSSDLFDLFGKCEGLKAIIYQGALPRMDALRNAVEANRNLEEVRITLTSRAICPCTAGALTSPSVFSCHRFSWVPTLKVLQAGPKLNEIVLRCLKSAMLGDKFNEGLTTWPMATVSDALLPFRLRNPFSAQVCGYHYK